MGALQLQVVTNDTRMLYLLIGVLDVFLRPL